MYFISVDCLYDADNRRVRKTLAGPLDGCGGGGAVGAGAGGATGPATDYFYDGWRVLESVDGNAYRRMFTRFLDVLAAAGVGNRPNRLEARARKCRPRNYQLLNKPVRLFRGIQIRSKYRASMGLN